MNRSTAGNWSEPWPKIKGKPPGCSKIVATVLLCLALLTARPAHSHTSPTAPLETTDTSALSATPPDLAPRCHAGLQHALIEQLQGSSLWPVITTGKMELALVILDDQDQGHLAMLNGRQMVYAASLPKIAILLGAMVALERGDLSLNSALEKDLNDMIRSSCNKCATRVLARVGREKLLEILQEPEFGFYDGEGRGGLWVGKDYGPARAYHRDPLRNISHAATAFQVARLYYRLERGSLLDPEHTLLMKQIMIDPAIRHKFVKGLAEVPGIRMLRKSGTWKNYHADSALVYTGDDRFILVGMAQHKRGEQLLQELARTLHEITLISGQLVARPNELVDCGAKGLMGKS